MTVHGTRPGWCSGPRLGAILIVLAMVVSACSSATGSNGGGRTILRVVMADDWATAPAMVDAVRSFEAEHEDVQVQIQGVPFPQMPEVVQTSIAADDPVDVAHWHAFAAAAEGLAQPIGDLWEGTLDPDEYIPGAVEDVTWAGQLYGVPLDTNAQVLMANPALLEDAGASMPSGDTVFGDVEAIARTVTSDDAGIKGIAVPDSAWFAYGWIRANGGELVHVGDDGSATFTLDAPEVVEALDFIGGLVAEGLAFPPSTRNVPNDAFALFRGSSAALHASGLWDVAALERSDIDWEPVVLPMPRGVDGSTTGTALGGSSLFVPTGVEDRELAFRFMVHLIDDERALRFAREEGRLPAQRDVFDDPFFDDPILRTVRMQLESAHAMKLIAFPEAQAAFVEAYEDILTGRASAREALTRAQRVAETSVGQG